MKIFLLALLSLGAILLNFEKVLASAILLIFLFLYIFNKKEIKAKETVLFVLVFLAFFIKSHISINNHMSNLQNTQEREVILTLTNPIIINGDHLKTRANLDGEDVQLAYSLNNREEKEFFEKKFYGGQIKALVEIKDIAEKKNFYSFDYKDYQNKQYVYKQVIIKDIKETSSKVNGIFNNINLLRSKAIQNINNNLLLDKAGYVQALIYGDKSNLEENDKEIYANIGISHLLAISGLHIAALLSIIYFILGKFNIEKNIKDRIILIILPIYAILAGFSPSVIRAVAMIAVYIIFKKLILASLDALFLVFLLMLFLNPYYVYDIGFQFSFFISFALLMSGEYIKKSLSKLEQAFKVSLIAGISSLPITVYYFNNFSFISILSNLIFVPYFTMIIFPIVIVSYSVFLVSVDLFNVFFKPILNLVFYINDKVLDIFNFLPNKWIIVKVSPYYIYLVLLVVILTLVYLNKEDYRKFTLGIIFLSLILFIANYSVQYNQYLYELKLNGKSVYYLRNKSKTILINTSNNYPDFKNDFRKKTKDYDIINQYKNLMDFEGIRKFNYLILTKVSPLEIGKATWLLSQGKADQVLILENIVKHKNIEEVIQVANLNNIKVSIIKDNKFYELGEVKIYNGVDRVVLKFRDKEYIINEEKSKK